MRRALIVAAALVVTLSLRAEEPGLARGFSADKVFDFQSGVDTVNTFQGNVSLRIPLGPSYPVDGGFSYGLSLAYNAKVWDYETYSGHPRAIANRRSNAGLGWLLSLGRLITPSSGTNNTGDYGYETPDGGSHGFWETLHHATASTALAPTVMHVRYSRDGSYLRLLVRDFNNDGNSDAVQIESPDGVIRTFDPDNGNLSQIRDRYGNGLEIAYPSSLTGTPCPASDTFAWVITDTKTARTNYVCFKHMAYFDSTYGGQVERVVLAAPPDPDSGAARTSTFVFNYSTPDIQRGCHSSYPNDNPLVEDVPMLTSITQNPNTTEAMTWSFTYNTSHTNGVCESGTLASYSLPTGATIDYTYRYWWLPVERCTGAYPWLQNYTGIATRTMSGPHIPDATWTYSSQQSTHRAWTTCPENERQLRLLIPSEQVVTTIVDPLGNVTEQYYSAWPMSGEAMWDDNGAPLPLNGNSPNGFRKNEYGLPFTRTPGTASGNYLLSQRVFTASGYAATPKTPLRSTYVTYERDSNNCSFLDAFCLDANERVTGERVVYHDDGGKVADTTYSSYDGLGNMRQVTTGGTFASGNVRTTYTAFNERDPDVNPASANDDVIDAGTYPDSFSMPTLTHAWVLGTASAVRVSEGSATATVQMCYEPLTGFLKARRVLKESARGTADLLVTFGQDGSGNVTSEAYAGGDVSANAPVTGSLCATATAPPAADYTITHGYDLGIRTTSQYAGASFLSLDRTIDAASGVTVSARDTAGYETTFRYDRAFRLKKVTPAGIAATTYAYVMPSGAGASWTPARAEEKTSATGLGTIESHYQYDSLGRIWRHKTLMPDDTWSVVETHRNGLGWPEWTSKRQKLTVPQPTVQTPSPTEYDFVPDSKTVFGGYDPFGRAATVTEPDGEVTSQTYTGVSSLTRSVTIGRGTGSFSTSTREVYDRQGRLSSVIEAAGTAGAVTTSYGYDVGGRLNLVSMAGGGGTQIRIFQYDNRGFLEFEQHPELGVDGHGRVVYGTYDTSGKFTGSYDARGHATRRITGAVNGTFDVTFAFDSAERLTSAMETASERTLTLFDYDDPEGELYDHCSGGRCNGKLAASGRYNYPDDLGTIAVAESYHYDGPGGRITRRDQSVGSSEINGATLFSGQNFFVSQTYDLFGNTSTLTYPCRKNVDGLCTAAPREVENGYTNGVLTSVTGFATSLTYQPNGMLATVVHANNVTDMITPSPSGMSRPCSLLTFRGSVVSTTTDPCGVTISASSPLSWTSGEYQYDGAGNVTRIGDTAYTYDAFSRLRGWTESIAGGAYNSTQLTMDTFGNHLSSAMKGCGTPVNGESRCVSTSSVAIAVAGTTNHYAAATYDAAGNVLTDVDHRTFAYDAFNRTKSTSASGREFRFIYGPDEERIAIVERVTNAGVTRNRTTWTLRGFGGELLSSWKDDATSGIRVWTWTEDEIRRGSLLLASVNPTRTLHYSLDHLGSPRVITDANGNLIGHQTFAPFGRGGTSDGGSLQFTGHERDRATIEGNADLPDYMHARYYNAQWGRFVSVDPVVGDPRVPQSWNRYAYVVNNPLKFVDVTGENATVVCDPDNNCTATVEAQIVADLNDPAQMAAARDFRNGAINYWQGLQSMGQNGETVTFQLNISIVGQADAVEGVDTIHVLNGSGIANVNMSLSIGGESTPDMGTIFTQDMTNNPSGMAGVAAHEAGHLMGLRDLYLPGQSVPYDGSAGADLMRHAQPTNGVRTAWWVLSPVNGNSVIYRQMGPPRRCLTGPC